MTVLYYLIWFINIGLALRKKKSSFIATISILFLGVVFCSNRGMSGDAYKYKMDFEHPQYALVWIDKGYVSLKNLAHMAGINTYNAFLVAIFAISIVLFYLGIRRFTNNYHPLIALTMVFIFPLWATAIRYFLATGIVVFAISELLLKKRKFVYILLVILASLFHRSMLFCLIYLLAGIPGVQKRLDTRAGKGLIMIVASYVLVFSVIVVFNHNKLPFTEAIINLITIRSPSLAIKARAYLSTSTHFGFVVLYLVYFVNLYTSYAFRFRAISAYRQQSDKAWIIDFSTFVFFMNLATIAFLPLFNINMDFFRLLVLPTVLNAIVFGCLATRPVFSDYMEKRRGAELTLIYLLMLAVWLWPLLIRINSISITEMIKASFFA